jgi:predicted alpha/beta hydrolase
MGVAELRVPAADGYSLAATLFEPERPSGQVAVVSAGMGIPRGFYGRYAAFLAARGIAALTYDYRGVGGSRPARLRGFPATCTDCGATDLAGAIGWAGERFPRVLAVGHSLGGQLVGLAPNNARLAGILAIAAPSGYWRLWPFPLRLLLWTMWRAVLPATAALFGMFPARALRLGEDVPEHVMREWCAWCRSPHYIAGPPGSPRRAGFERVTAPFRAYSFSDDVYAPRRAVDALLGLYPNAHVEHHHVTPRDLGAALIGHFGFFRDGPTQALWVETADWLAAA